MLELMIENAASSLRLGPDARRELDFAGCMRGIHGMIDQEADCLDIIILDALASLARSIAEEIFWQRGGSPDEEKIYSGLLFWLGDIL